MKKENIQMINPLLLGKIPVDTEVTIRGWVKTRRDSKAGLSFIMVHDGSCFHPIQVIASQVLQNYENEILNLTTGCSVIVTGKLVASPAKGQKVELQASQIEVVGWVDNPDTYPISPKHHTLEYLREHTHLRIRTNIMGAVMRVRSLLAYAIHQFFYQRGFYWLASPIITSSDGEGAGEMFRVSIFDFLNLPRDEKGEIDFSKDFFGKETFLTVTGQLNAEAYASALTKVYTFGPTFRAENSNTSRHLAEFWMIEPEVAFADLNDLSELAKDLLKHTAQFALDQCAEEMTFFAERVDKNCIVRLEKMLQSDFVKMEYSEAIQILQQSNKQFEFPVKWGIDLQSEHERYLTEEYVKKPIVMINYPKEIKAFYMRANEDHKTVAAMDILVPGVGEIIGGSQREERLEFLERRLDELKMNKILYEWYLDLRRYGTVPHSGFGLGFERLLNYITGMENIRDVIPFPRTPKHADY